METPECGSENPGSSVPMEATLEAMSSLYLGIWKILSYLGKALTPLSEPRFPHLKNGNSTAQIAGLKVQTCRKRLTRGRCPTKVFPGPAPFLSENITLRVMK